MRKQRKINSEELSKLEKIEEEWGLNPCQIERKTWLMCENFKSLEQEEQYWFERSHVSSLLKGDQNIKFFHKCASGRKKKNAILSLENEGVMIEGDENAETCI